LLAAWGQRALARVLPRSMTRRASRVPAMATLCGMQSQPVKPDMHAFAEHWGQFSALLA